MTKMAKPYRKIFFEDFNGSIKELRAFIKLTELLDESHAPEEVKQKVKRGLPLLKHVYCERIKNNKVIAEIEEISVNHHNKIHGLIWIKDKESGEFITCCDVIDKNNTKPIFYISDGSCYKNFSIDPDALASYYYDCGDPEYHDCIHKALRKYCKEHFYEMHDMIQTVQNKRYLEMIE